MHLAMGFEKKGIDVNGPMPDGVKKRFEWCQKVPRSAICGVKKRQGFDDFGPECARWCQILFFLRFLLPKVASGVGGRGKKCGCGGEGGDELDGEAQGVCEGIEHKFCIIAENGGNGQI